MERLTQRDLATLLEFLEETYALTDLDDLALHLVRRLPGLVGSEVTGYNELNRRKRRMDFFHEPRVQLRDAVEIFNRYAHQHPLIRHHERVKDGEPAAISDYLTQRQLRRLDLYNEFFRPIGVDYQVVFTLRRSDDLIVALALGRKGRDFSGRDRALLSVLRPHLLCAYRNAESLTGLQRELGLLIQEAEATGISIVSLAPDGRIRAASPTAIDRLADYFAPAARDGGRLPDAVSRWIRAQTSLRDVDESLRPRTPMIVEKAGCRLVLRLAGSVDRPLLLIEERRAPVVGRSLQAVGLTEREADVLAWVGHGKRDSEIGAILRISPRTVAKHLEHIFQKLGVETRTAAAARAHEMGIASASARGTD